MNVKSRKTKILYVITKSVWGGAQKYITDLASALDKNSFEIFVAAGGAGPFKERIDRLDISYINIPHFDRDIKIFSDLISFFEVIYIIWKLKPDILHSNSSKAGGVCGIAGLIYYLTGHKIRMIFTAHGWAFNERRGSFQLFWIRFFSRLTSLFYDKIICVSKFDRKTALANKIAPENKLIAIHNGLNIPDFFPKEIARKNLGVPENSLIIGSIAEYTKNKGLDILLKSTARISKGRPDVRILLVGWGEKREKEALFDLAEKLNLKEIVIFRESSPESYLNAKAFDIFVMPSRKEGLSYMLLEASSAELPIVATSVGGNPEIVEDGKTGLLVPAENESMLEEAIKKLLNDRVLAQELGSEAKKKVQKDFTIEKMREDTYSLYRGN